MATMMNSLAVRHIQNMSEADNLEPHWGYADRVVPCTNDPGSCEYLDVVYHSHDLGMLYTGIFWATIGGILFLWYIGRKIFQSPTSGQDGVLWKLEGQNQVRQGGVEKLRSTIASYSRQFLLPESLRLVFGRVTRLQVVILATLVGYLTIWSFVGIVYKKWVTPVKNMEGVYNTRSSLGPWSDRVGVLAYALTPLSVLLSSRESILSLVTGIPYQHFNFLHRWLGYVIFVQSALHTIGWCVIEIRLYQPQPMVANMWIKQTYMIWGVIAMFILTVLFILSTPWAIRRTGYEFFRKAHYVLAMVYIGACWGHWEQLKCFLLPSLLLWFLDRGIRLVRTGLIHYRHLPGGPVGFQSSSAKITHYPDPENGDVVRLDFVQAHDAWEIGQHFYLCFPAVSLWQSHPFTPCCPPGNRAEGQKHAYVLRAKKGATKVLADIAAVQCGEASDPKKSEILSKPTTSVILSGPYGTSTVSHLSPQTNILCVAGGTGVSFVLPVILSLVNQPASNGRQVGLIWAVRRDQDVEWISEELDTIRRAQGSLNIKVKIFVTRETGASNGNVRMTRNEEKGRPDLKEDQIAISSSSSSASASQDSSFSKANPSLFSIHHPLTTAEGNPESRHPDLSTLVGEFVDSTTHGPATVYASGPGGMISDLRRIVASQNSGSKVWSGDQRHDVKLVCDDRLEW
ncbi:hypothetical protein PV10_02760 [Exophiala mesophila]|uniref:FAD-binding FR-type domain-containing protein n=1 Tax=Exophiala mesophila TaxID=212818 RepID=A0A0D2A7Y3_EXOME|nr:uncharacterized protein PV10_02760 [Exophiala mesophila]KIV95058.1 hypothetical protein PV10_02760 [Exophiala mesophila]